jgi:fumarate hydratase subunit alpha
MYIHAGEIETLVRDLCIKAATDLPGDVALALLAASRKETSPLGREILGAILKNAEFAKEKGIPICQDTGLTYVFLEIGREVHIEGDIKEAVTKGVARGYTEGYLRKSVVKDPLFRRENTGDNTPPVIHIDIVPGSQVAVTVLPKGTGSENMSAVRMLTPSRGPQGVMDFVLETVRQGAPNACPPLVVGVGVGGMMDTASFLAKKALLRPVGDSNCDSEIASMERMLLAAINNLGVGPGGLGGSTTALAVHIETYPTHIGALPVAVNLQCHAARRASGILRGAEKPCLDNKQRSR